MKKIYRLTIALFSIGTVPSQAAIVIQDVNAKSVTTLGSNIELVDVSLHGLQEFIIKGGLAASPSGLIFNDPTATGPTSNTSISAGGVYFIINNLVNNANLGLNYFLTDSDENGYTDTFVEFTIGTDASDFSDDFITRVVYENDPSASLTYSQGVAALDSVPEPSSTLLLSIGALGLVTRRKRTI